MTVTDIAQEIYDDLGDTSLSVAVITTFLRNRVGAVNLLIYTDFEVDSATFELTPSPTDEEKEVFRLVYLIYYYGKKINTGLGASAFDSIVEIADDGTRTRFVNKNEVAKTFMDLLKQSKTELNEIVNGYRSRAGAPVSVDGNDVLEEVLVEKYSRGRVS